MSGYLGGSYLDSEDDDLAEYDAGNATTALQPALGDGLPDNVTLPGGISMPRKTFYLVLGLLALVVLLVIIRKMRVAKSDDA